MDLSREIDVLNDEACSLIDDMFQEDNSAPSGDAIAPLVELDNGDRGITDGNPARGDVENDWHTRMEKDLITDFGGTPSESFGADGELDDAPVEVRLARTEDRFRLNRDTHQTLVNEDGAYIFDDVTDFLPPREVEADRVDDLLDEDWHSDRGYRHQFVAVDDIF
jgi:hypothetical protein